MISETPRRVAECGETARDEACRQAPSHVYGAFLKAAEGEVAMSLHEMRVEQSSKAGEEREPQVWRDSSIAPATRLALLLPTLTCLDRPQTSPAPEPEAVATEQHLSSADSSASRGTLARSRLPV